MASKKKELLKEIAATEAEIKELEAKRERSQSAIIRRLVAKQDPEGTEDWAFFCQYSSEIDVKRDVLKELNEKLKGLK